MKVAVLTKAGFGLRDADMPACGQGQVLIKTAAVGVCEGEIFRYRTLKESGQWPPEVWMGHEGSGTVVKIGERAEGLHEGDVVTALGGAFAEYFAAPAGRVVKLPAGVDPIWALGEPIACCVHAGWRFGVRLGDRVAVIGAGFMGLMCLQLARLHGAAHVRSFDLLPWRLPVARELGADEVCDPSGRKPEDVSADTGEYDVVIEAAGTQSSVNLAGELVREHGRLILVGYHQTDGGTRTVNMKLWNWKAIDVVNGHVRNMDEKFSAMRAGVELMEAGRLQVEPLVTPYPLCEAARAFEDLRSRKEGLFKAVLVPSDG